MVALISGVILAAGASKRMGAPKLLKRLAGRPILDYVVDAFCSSRLDEVLVVTNEPVAEALAAEGRPGVRVLLNRDPEAGMSASLRLGLGEVRGRAAVIGLGDQPLLLPSTIDRIVSEYTRSGAMVVVPVHDGLRGNPVLFHRSMFPQIMAVRGDRGAKSVVSESRDRVREVEVDDEGILLDVDTPADLARAKRKFEERTRQMRSRASGARPPRSQP
jgi:molybdenum cofactor cytidylyltransferase